MKRSIQNGFTLVELMVVILVLGILGGVLSVAVYSAFSKSGEAETQSIIETLGSGVDRFNMRWHYYPQASLYQLSTGMSRNGFVVGAPNSTNEGIECLVMALRTREGGGPFIGNEFLTQYQSNTDADEITDNFANIEGNLKLFEIRDGWLNPLVYVNLLDLKVNPALKSIPITIKCDDGPDQIIDLNELEAKLVDPETGLAVAKGWCIWSFGPDGINDYGRADDITSWPKIIAVE